MLLFLRLSLVLIPLQALMQLLMCLIIASSSLMTHLVFSMGAHFVHVAYLRYAGSHWWYGSLFCVVVHVILALSITLLSHGGGKEVWVAISLYAPGTANTLFMLTRRPRWELVVEIWTRDNHVSTYDIKQSE